MKTTFNANQRADANLPVLLRKNVGDNSNEMRPMKLWSLLILVLLGSHVAAQTITTIAGTGSIGYTGNGGQATAATFYYPMGVVADRHGNVYIADYNNNHIRKIDSSGIITNYAGNGSCCYGGEGGQATAEPIGYPQGLAIDTAGNIYFPDTYSSRIRKISTSGIISTIAGNGTSGFSGDGGAATAATLNGALNCAVDGAGNVYFVDQNNQRVRKISNAGIITTIAGNGTSGLSGDGGPGTAAQLSNPLGIAADASGNVYIADRGNQRIRKVNTSGVITTVAGSGSANFSGDGGPATSALLSYPTGVALDASGRIYIADAGNQRIRIVSTIGVISTIAGTGVNGFSGDGGAATAAKISDPQGLGVDADGYIYIADRTNQRVRKVTPIPVPTIPTFDGGSLQSLTVCKNSSSNSINSLLTVTDAGIALTETYSVIATPSHGSISIGSTVTSDTSVAPTGWSYTPTSGYSGSDVFTIQVSNGTGGMSSTTINVTVNTLPTVNISAGTNPICPGNSTSLTASGATNYNWTPAASLLVNTGSGNSANPTSTTTYTVSGVNDNGCINMASITVSVNPTYAIAASAGSNGSVSPSGTINVCSGNSQSYTITPNSGYAIASVTVDGSSVSVMESYTFTGVTTGHTISVTFVPLNRLNLLGLNDTITAKVAYSLRRLSGDYTGNLIQVRRSSDNALKDIGWNIEGNLDEDTLTTFVGTGNGYIVKWYDQSGNGKNVVQNSTSAQPTIVSDGILNLTNSRPAINFNNGGYLDGSGNYGISYQRTMNTVYNLESGSAVVIDRTTSGTPLFTISNGQLFYRNDANAGLAIVGTAQTPPFSNCFTATLGQSNTAVVYKSSAINDTRSVGMPSTMDPIRIGGPVSTAELNMWELTLFPIELPTTERQTLECNQMHYYNLPVPTVASSGSTAICAGSSATLTASGTATYTWLPATGLSATTGNTVTANPTATTLYTITGTTYGCSSRTTLTVSVTAVSAINAGSDVTICSGSSTTLTATGGTFYSWSPATGLTSTAGAIVTASPTATTTYTVTGYTPGECTNTATVTVSVNPLSFPGIITGEAAFCMGTNTTLTASGSGGGVWSSTNNAVATVAGGVVSGITSGNTTISYTVDNGCGPVAATMVVTVNPLVTASVITGSNAICQGASTALSATGGTGGGVWSSTNPSIATVSTSGVVTGTGPGNTTISYTVTNVCGVIAATHDMTINPLPATPVPITGPSAVCTGNTISLYSSTGGIWSSSNITRATVNASGVVTGISPSPVAISYTISNGCGSISAISLITVNATPGSISGPNSVCIGALITLTNTPGGGIWSSPDATVSVNAANGKVTGITQGIARISYSLGTGCAATTIVTVISTPGTFGGTLNACPGSTTALTNTTSGGTWSSSSSAKATVDLLTGLVTAVSPGVTYITYTLSPGCYNAVAVTINPAPGAITGALAICPGTITNLNSTTTGGVWTSGNTAIATVNSTTGLVTSVAGVGTTTISYVVGSLCPRAVVVTVAASSANVGTPIVCLGQPVSVAVLTNPTPGGTWSSSDPLKAPINQITGVLKGISAGTVTITYQLGPGCISTSELTINPAVAPVTGPAAICPGATAMFGNSTPGGTWSSSNTAVATAGTSGLVAGIFEGTTTISYIVNEGCYNTKDVTIYGSMADISGTDVICAGSETNLSSGPAGGTWSSGHTTANINATTGLLTGVSAGTAMITYFNGSSGCYVTRQVTINGSVATITGTANICPGSSTTLGNGDAGGVWSSGNTAVATVDASGSVTGISSGTAIITYMTTPACYKTTIQTIKTAPSAIGGATDVCQNATATLTSGPAGGVWSSSNTANATISSTGVVRGIAPGSTTIQYTLGTGCMVSQDVTVNSLPDAITGVTSVCVNATTDLFSSPSGGTWSSSNTVKSTIDATTGVLTGKSAGNSNITYTLPSGCYVKTTATTKAPPSAISGTTTIAVGAASILNCYPGGGTWSSADPGIASYNPVQGGRTYGVSAGTTTVSYTVSSTGCFSTTEVTIVAPRPGQGISVNGEVKMFNIYPNPSQGVLNVETLVSGTFAVFTIDGRQVASYEITETATTLSLPNDLASGMYMCKFTGTDGSTEMVRLVYER